jgi:hypothetical protein
MQGQVSQQGLQARRVDGRHRRLAVEQAKTAQKADL